MAANKACKKKSDENKSSKTFSWTDEETSLLLQVVIDYKASKTATGLDWETVKNRYEDITERFQAQYPREGARLETRATRVTRATRPNIFITKTMSDSIISTFLGHRRHKNLLLFKIGHFLKFTRVARVFVLDL